MRPRCARPPVQLSISYEGWPYWFDLVVSRARKSAKVAASSVSTRSSLAASPLAPKSLLASNTTLLWSAGNRLKFKINERYFGSHYVWCSPVFEAATMSHLSTGAGQPASSDPATIYRRLHKEVEDGDKHSLEITRQRDSIKNAAVMLEARNVIDHDVLAEISAIVDAATNIDFTPLLYVIPYSLVSSRVQPVPFGKRASMEPEYIIPDLVSQEFQIIEPWPCPSKR